MAKERNVQVTFKVINSDFNSKVKAMNKQMKELRSEFTLNEAKMKTYSGTGSKVAQRFDYLKNKSSILNKELDIAKSKSQAAHEAYDRLAKSGTASAEELSKMKTQVNAADAALIKAQANASKAAKELSNFSKAGAHLKNISTITGNVAAKLKGVSAGAAAVIGATSKLASDYNDKMAKVNTIAKLNGKDLESLSKRLLKVSTDTGKSATETAEAAYQALSASVPADKLTSFVKTATNLGKTGYTETSTAVDVLTTAMNSYGKAAGSASDIANKLITVQNDGKVTVNELAQSMGNSISTAKTYGVNLDNLSASYVYLTKQGIDSARSTTGINSMLNELGSASKTTGKILKKETGKSFSQLMKSGMSLRDVLEILYKSTGKSDDKMKALFGNANAGKTAMALLTTSTKEYNGEVNKLKNSQGAVSDALKKLDTPASRAKKAMNALKNSGISVGESFLTIATPAIKEFSQWSQRLADYTANMSDSEKKFVSSLLIGTASLWAGAKAIQGITGTASTLITGAKTLHTAITGITSATGAATTAAGTMAGGAGLGAIAAAAGPVALVLGGVVTAAVLAKKQYDRNTASLSKMTNGMDSTTQKADSLRSAIKSNVNAYDDNISRLTENANTAETLADRIDKLSHKENKSAGEKKKLKAMVQQLNSVMPGLNASYDAEKDKLNKSTDAIKRNIDMLKNQAIAKQLAAQESAIYTNYAKLETTQIEQQAKIAELQAKRNMLVDKRNDASSAYQTATGKYGQGSPQAQTAWQAMDKYGDQITKLDGSLQKVKSSLSATEKQMTSLNNKANTVSFAKAIAQAQAAGTKIPKSLKAGIMATMSVLPSTGKQLANMVKYQSAINAAKKAGIKIPKNLANGMLSGKTSPKSAQKQINSLISKETDKQKPKQHSKGKALSDATAKGIKAGKGNVTSAAAGVGKGATDVLGQHVNGKGAGSKLSSGMAQGVNSKKGKVKAAAKSTAKAGQSAAKMTGGQSIGANFVSGIVNGISGIRSRLISRAKSIAASLPAAVRKVLGIHSPSRVMHQIGLYTMQGLSNGLVRGGKSAVKKAASVAKSVYKNFSTASKKARGLNKTQTAMYWKQVVNETKKGTKAHSRALKKYTTARKSLSKSVNTIRTNYTNSITKSTNAYLNDVKSVNKNLNETIKDLKKSYSDTVNEKWSNLRSQYNLTDRMSEGSSGYTSKGLITNMKSQAKYAQQYYAVLDGLEIRLGKNSYLWNDLKNQGVSALPLLRSIAMMSDSELKTYKKAYDERNAWSKKEAVLESERTKESINKQISTAQKDAKNQIAKLKATYTAEIKKAANTAQAKSLSIGLNINRGISRGVKLSEKSTIKTLESTMAKYVKSIKAKLKIHSPSRVTRDEIGKMMAAGVGVGFNDQMESEMQSMQMTVQRMSGGLQLAWAGRELQPNNQIAGLEEAIRNIMINVSVNAEMDGDMITRKVSHRQGIALKKQGAK